VTGQPLAAAVAETSDFRRHRVCRTGAACGRVLFICGSSGAGFLARSFVLAISLRIGIVKKGEFCLCPEATLPMFGYVV